MSSEGSAIHQGPADDEFAELSAILLAAERSQLTELKHRLENPEARARDVALVLAEAIRLRAAGDTKLRRALQPTIEEAIGVAVRKNPHMLASALFPIFGKAIRKAIASELDGMIQALSQVLEQRLSLRSLKWRIEALRTNKSYAEIVLLRSVLYRVEQVFLIHRKTGLLLLHEESGSSGLKDPEMVSGMLTALQDFARDAISGAEGENLETVRLGDFTVVLAYGPELILAGFVRGVAPRGLNRLFQDELDSIQEEQSAASVDFSGDTSKFESSRPHLEKCLVGQGDPRAKAPASSLAARLLLFGIPALLIAVALGWWLVSLRAERRWQSLLEQLGSQPGIVITTSGERGGKRFISGLRDPLAADPAAMVSAAGLSNSQVDFRWEPYHSLHPRFAAERQYSAVKEQLERSAIRFSLGSAAIPTEAVHAVDELASQVTALFNAAATTGREVKIEILGSTDFRGRSELNVNLARDRAATVEAALAGLGVPREQMQARGLTSPCGLARGRDDAACRTATLRVLEVSR